MVETVHTIYLCKRQLRRSAGVLGQAMDGRRACVCVCVSVSVSVCSLCITEVTQVRLLRAAQNSLILRVQQ